MKVGVVGPSYEMRSLPFDAQRSINIFPVLDQQGKEVAAMYGAPGKNSFCTVGSGGTARGCFTSANGRAFIVSGSGFYEVFSDGTATKLGELDQSSGIVTIAEINTQLGVCDGVNVYILTYATDVFQKISSAGIPAAGFKTITSIDGYFIGNENDSGRFWISDLNDGTSWPAEFATAESSPDLLLSCINALGQLWLIGNRSIEVWTNTGEAAFPFRRVSSAVVNVGSVSAFTSVPIDNGVVVVGSDENGDGVVYKLQGLTPVRISTTAIEKFIQSAESLDQMRAFTYQEEGAVFYVLTGGGLATSLCYDFSTQQWHERARMRLDGIFEQDKANCHMFAFGKHLVGDRLSDVLYEQSLDYYEDGDEALVCERIYTHLSDENKKIRYNALEIGLETGVGLQTGQGSMPLVMMQLSKNGGRTWTDWSTASFGAVGQYQTKVEFRRLGIAEQMTFKIRISDPVKRAIVGSYLR